jgi:glycosyltransferase involved in cell wall biosynthesis
VRSRRALRVAVPSDLLRLTASTGHGKVWGTVLAGLSEHARLVVEDPGHGVRRRLRRRTRPDVWLASGHERPPEGATAPGSAPLVEVVHEVGWRDPDVAHLLSPSFREAIDAATSQALSVADHVITPSQWSRRGVLAAYGLPGEAVHVVAYGVDADTFRPGLGGGRQLVAERLGGAGAYVLFVGVRHPRKNLAALRDAMAILAGRDIRRALVVVSGEAGDRSQGASAAPGAPPGPPAPELSLQGISERQLAALMAGADAFCLPSLGEGFGLPALEAMACGAPIVASDRGALPATVGGGAIVVTPEAASVAEALQRVLVDEREADRLRAAGRERALEFPWSRTVSGWLAVLERAAQEPPSG